MDIERLELKAGEAVTAAHINALDRGIARNAGLPGVRVRRRIYPWGTSHSFYGSGGGVGDAPIFRPEVSIEGDVATVRWGGPRALIGGVVPTIGEGADRQEIFLADETTGDRPALLVPRDRFDPATGECGIFFRVTVDPTADFTARLVEPVAVAGRPPRQPLLAFKLALFLRLRDGVPSYREEDDRELFCGQGFLAINRRPSGTFEPLFWAKF